MAEDRMDNWERFLTPKVLRTNLIIASIYIVVYERLKEVIVGTVKDFFEIGFDDGEFMLDEQYKIEVLSKSKSPLYASIDWYQEHAIIDENDIELFNKAKKYRNKIAHELDTMTYEGLPSDAPDQIQIMIALIEKISRWWFVNVELALNPTLSKAEIDPDEVIPGSVLSLKAMIEVALGDDDTAEFYIKEFKKLRGIHQGLD